MTELSVGAKFSVSGMLPVHATLPSPVDVFLAVGLPGDVLTLFDMRRSMAASSFHTQLCSLLKKWLVGLCVRGLKLSFSSWKPRTAKSLAAVQSSLPGGSAGGAPADTLPALLVASADGQLTSFPQFTSPQSKQITFDDLIPFRGVAYAKETMPEPYRAMLEKRMYLPLPALTHKNVHDLRTGLKHDEMAKIGNDKDPEAKLGITPSWTPTLLSSLPFPRRSSSKAYQLLILTMKESPVFGGAVATMLSLVRFDHKWLPSLDMHEHVAFINEQCSLEARQERDEAVAVALRDVSHGEVLPWPVLVSSPRRPQQ
ncbi:hypothetical protein BS47DRAFT_1402179 [Hydnum rufescens UP504]|uniref:Uncharacterized protein n=1 Tax=Hydnum rufescens UP504 TaxID=1448309 RepID=A0A9P6DH12_9AGAM|nr:hypothetical protein BS47DRAFT_1402179 [Hydnum rufescens UP504]